MEYKLNFKTQVSFIYFDYIESYRRKRKPDGKFSPKQYMVSQNLLCYFSLVILCFFRVNTQKDKKRIEK